MAVSVRAKLWTRDEYDRLVHAGAFAPGAHLQLVQGEIVEMTPQGPAHATAVRRLQETLGHAFPRGYDVRAQLPLALAGDAMSEPEPDIAVVPGAIGDYRDHHPTTAVLVVEVADTSVDFDRTRKAEMYARAGVPEYWVLNIPDQTLEIYREPVPEASHYRNRTTLHADDHIVPTMGSSRPISVAAILP